MDMIQAGRAISITIQEPACADNMHTRSHLLLISGDTEGCTQHVHARDLVLNNKTTNIAPLWTRYSPKLVLQEFVRVVGGPNLPRESIYSYVSAPYVHPSALFTFNLGRKGTYIALQQEGAPGAISGVTSLGLGVECAPGKVNVCI